MRITEERVTYQEGLSPKELGNYLKAILLPIGVFFLVKVST